MNSMSIDNRKSSSPLSRKPKNIKYYNQKLVLSLLRTCDTMTASEISERISLSVTSVTKILAALQKYKLVKSMGKGSSTEEGGKKPELYALNDTHKYIIAIHSGIGYIDCVLYNLKCELVNKLTVKYREQANYDTCMEDIAHSAEELLALSDLLKEDIYGVIVGFDGIVDADNGILLFPIHNTTWGRNLKIIDKLKDLMPGFENLHINNGSRLSGYAELLKHPEYADESVTVLISGSYTGGCVLDHGKLIQGANGFVGEFGHITVASAEETEKCACGNSGCFETLVSPKAIQRYAMETKMNYPNSPLLKEEGKLQYLSIFKASNEGDAFACRIMDKIISYFVLLIRNMILIHNPRVIVLQGIYTQAGDYFLNKLQSEIHSLPFFKIEKEFNLVYSDIGLSQGCFTGGALILADQYFNETEIYEL